MHGTRQRIGPERELSQLATLRQTNARKIISRRFACPRAADWTIRAPVKQCILLLTHFKLLDEDGHGQFGQQRDRQFEAVVRMKLQFRQQIARFKWSQGSNP